ncbi:hypothetical protein K439DRAFT_935729 [Ramaria rubella]|nr:hypothetical protein K439DRAFT_935729 [Ramaria rubella]
MTPDAWNLSLFLLQFLGFISLSALVLTVILSETIHRHVLFANFICISLAYCAFNALTISVAYSQPEQLTEEFDQMNFIGPINDFCFLAGLTSFLNFLIHLWFTMKTPLHTESARIERLRTFTLLVFPYLLGILPLSELYHQSPAHRQRMLNIVAYMNLILTAVASIWNVLLVITFVQYRRDYDNARMQGAMPSSLLIRVLVLTLSRIVFLVAAFAFDFLAMKSKPNSISQGILIFGESTFPLLTFCLLGTQQDILRLWFPSLRAKPESFQQTDFESVSATGKIIGFASATVDVNEQVTI